MKRAGLMLALWSIASVATAQTPPAVTPGTAATRVVPVDGPYRDRSLSARARAEDIVSRMTLEEKAGQIQHNALAIPRLGVPAYNWWNEGLHGVARTGEATVFPQAIGMAATWDVDLIGRVADVIASEFRAKNLEGRDAEGATRGFRGLTVWSPNVNIFRDPRWGRGQETYGEDPYLTSRLAVAFIEGLQGDDPLQPKVAATVKHIAVHSGPEANRHREDVHPSPRDVTETYLPAFHAAVTEARVEGMMCAYNAIDGVPACANTDYLQRRLREEWSFEGHVVSDCAAVADVYLSTSHAYVRTPEEAVALTVKAGVDLICEFTSNASARPEVTVNAVRQGLLTEAELSAAVVRLFEIRIRLGLLDPHSEGAYAAIGPKDYDTPANNAVALETARASLVLLKNDGLLPLTTTPGRIAVIGPNADSVDALVGNYNGTPSTPSTILAGLRARYPEAVVDYVEGTGWVAPPLEDIGDAAFCVDADCREPGLKMEEFAGPELQGAPVNTRTETNAVFGWGRPNREDRESSVRFTGFVQAPEAGDYRFRYASESGYRIYVDDRLVADVWDIAWPTSDTVVALEPGRAYAIRIEAVQRGIRGTQRLQWSRPSTGNEPALAVARNADLIVFAGGLTARLEGEEMVVQAPGFAGGDRTSLDLPAPQQQLLEALHATGKPVVFVLMSGSAMGITWAQANLPAIVQAWYPGGEGGQAVAEMIAGDFSPSGRLPVTFYRSVDDLPPFGDYAMQGRTYRYFEGEPLYPFGYGLSYTQFAYGGLSLSTRRVDAGDSLTATVSVTNAGDRAGAEVVQVYAARPGTEGPARSLVGFQRVEMAPGESRDVRFTLAPMAMSVVGADGHRRVPAGTLELWIGGGQPGTASAGVATQVEIVGDLRVADF